MDEVLALRAAFRSSQPASLRALLSLDAEWSPCAV
jgi:hypothetical protein